MGTTVTIWIISLSVAMIVAVLIGRKKNIDPFTYWGLGLLLGWIGCVILLCMKTQLPRAPMGMLAVKCARCNTVQNVTLGQDKAEHCFRCEAALPRPLTTDSAFMKPKIAPIAPNN